jgi:predicted Zn-dependent protease
MLPDDPLPRKRLLQLALKQKRYHDAVDLGKRALYVDVVDAETHREMAEAYLGDKSPQKALPELEAAADLKPKDDEIELLLAKTQLTLGRPADAKTHLKAIVERDAKNAEARSLLESLK